MNGTILIYGATGYTGKLIAKVAADQGARPILAGRNLEKVEAVAKPLGLTARAFDLRDPGRIDAAIRDVSVVLCIAGPFSATSRPVADACLRNRVHYLDITGEIDVFEALVARDAEAKPRGVTLIPGVGFDVVPSDCLAAHLKRRLPDANDLKLYLSVGANMSRGTAKTMVEAIAAGTRLRRDGLIVSRDWAETGSCDFGEGEKPTIQVSWATSRQRFIRPAFPTSRSISRRRQRSAGLHVHPGLSNRSLGWASCKASSSLRSTGYRRGRAKRLGERDEPCWLARRVTRPVKRFARA